MRKNSSPSKGNAAYMMLKKHIKSASKGDISINNCAETGKCRARTYVLI